MGKKYYAVCAGRKPGIYDNWEETKAQVDGFKNAKFKGFTTKEEAIAYLNGNVHKQINSIVSKTEVKKTVSRNENKNEAKRKLIPKQQKKNYKFDIFISNFILLNNFYN